MGAADPPPQAVIANEIIKSKGNSSFIVNCESPYAYDFKYLKRTSAVLLLNLYHHFGMAGGQDLLILSK